MVVVVVAVSIDDLVMVSTEAAGEALSCSPPPPRRLVPLPHHCNRLGDLEGDSRVHRHPTPLPLPLLCPKATRIVA